VIEDSGRVHYRRRPPAPESDANAQREVRIQPRNGSDAVTYTVRDREVLITRRGRGSFWVDNSWVVPYNPAVLLKYGCHINVERVVGPLQALKYLFKYVCKGVDMVSVAVDAGEDIDEIDSYVAARYVSDSEAA
jgi:hypothetical protein